MNESITKTNDELDEVLSYIDLVADKNDLKLIQQHMLAKLSHIDSVSKIKFTEGDKVGFIARGHTYQGIITKINRKRIKVQVRDIIWTVYPSSLWHIDD